MGSWYYRTDDGLRGPLPFDDVKALVNEGRLPSSVWVWTEAFGNQWKQAGQTELARLGHRPPPLTAKNVEYDPASPHGPDASVSDLSEVVPTSAKVPAERRFNPTWEWLLALYPLLVTLFDFGLSLNFGGTITREIDRNITFASHGMIVGLAMQDTLALRHAGLNPQRRRLWLYMFLTPIAYFVARKIVAERPLKPLWIWLLCCAAAISSAFLQAPQSLATELRSQLSFVTQAASTVAPTSVAQGETEWDEPELEEVRSDFTISWDKRSPQFQGLVLTNVGTSAERIRSVTFNNRAGCSAQPYTMRTLHEAAKNADPFTRASLIAFSIAGVREGVRAAFIMSGDPIPGLVPEPYLDMDVGDRAFLIDPPACGAVVRVAIWLEGSETAYEIEFDRPFY